MRSRPRKVPKHQCFATSSPERLCTVRTAFLYNGGFPLSLDQCFHHGIVEHRPDLLDALRLVVRPSPIGQQSNGNALFTIDPQRRAGITEMSEGVRRKVLSRL